MRMERVPGRLFEWMEKESRGIDVDCKSQFWWALTPGDDDASLKPAKVYPNHDRFTFDFPLPNSFPGGVQRVLKNSNWIFDDLENGNRNPGERN